MTDDKMDDDAAEAATDAPQEKAVALEDYKRLAADFDNYRRQAERTIATARESGEASMARDLLAVLDDFDSAESHYEQNKEMQEGIVGLKKRLYGALKSHGLEEIPSCEGQKFDPTAHDAARTDATCKAGIVSSQMRKGYAFRGNIIRHPLVAVGCAENQDKKTEDKKDDSTQQGKKTD